MPPQFGKSTAVHHWLARIIGRFPHLQSAYCSYAADLARTQSRRIRNIALAAGVELDSSANRLEEWLTTEGGGLVATGVGGPLTGKPISGVGVIDDPIKNREEAESARSRETTWDWYTDTFLSRLHKHSSQVIIMTRWHPDDLIGRVTNESDDWIVVSLPAINEFGESLWPEEKPVPFLMERRAAVGEYGWQSMYMQNPRPRGGTLFNDPVTCLLADVPTTGQFSAGIDLAYTKKTKSDHSSIVTLVQSAPNVYHVSNVRRWQADINSSDAKLLAFSRSNPGVRMTWHASGMEARAVGDRLVGMGLPLTVKIAVSDKYVRAQPVSAKWNGTPETEFAKATPPTLIVPRDATWSAKFIDEVTNFTGVDGNPDDQVDALASADDGLSKNTVIPQSTGTRTFASSGAGGWRNY